MLSRKLFHNDNVKLFLEKFRPGIGNNWVYPKPLIVVNDRHEEVKVSPACNVWDIVPRPFGQGLVPVLNWPVSVTPPSSDSLSELTSVLLTKEDKDRPREPSNLTPSSDESAGDGILGTGNMSKHGKQNLRRDSRNSGTEMDGKDDTDMSQNPVGSWKDWTLGQGSVEETPELAPLKHYSTYWGNIVVKSPESSLSGSSKPTEKKHVYSDLISHPHDPGLIGSLNVTENWNYVKKKMMEPSQSDGENVPQSLQLNSNNKSDAKQEVNGPPGTVPQGYKPGLSNSFNVPKKGNPDGAQLYEARDDSLNIVTQEVYPGSGKKSEPSKSGLKTAVPHITRETISPVRKPAVSSASVKKNTDSFKKLSMIESSVSKSIPKPLSGSSNALYRFSVPSDVSKSIPKPLSVSSSALHKISVPSDDTLEKLAKKSISEPGSSSSPMKKPLTKPAQGIKTASSKGSSYKSRQPPLHLVARKYGCNKKDSCSGEGQPKCKESQETLNKWCGKNKASGSGKVCDGDIDACNGGRKENPCKDACKGGRKENPCTDACKGGRKENPCTNACKGGRKENPCTDACMGGRKENPCTDACKGGRKENPCTDACKGGCKEDTGSGESRSKCKESDETLAKCPGKTGGKSTSCGGDKCSTICGAGTRIGRINPCKGDKCKKTK